ncbi:MAG: TRAP transporter substrate-binding protein DctP [Pleomorphochaeta sp.]
MKKILTIVMALCLFSVSIFANGSSEDNSQKTWDIKLSHAGPASENNDDYIGAKTIKDEIEKNSNGQITVTLYPGSQLGNYQEVMEQVDEGVLEIAHTSIGGVTPFLPEMAVVDLQYLIPNDEVVVELMKEGTFFDEMSKAIQEKLPNVNLVGVCDGGRWRSFYTTKKEVKDVSDLSGLKIRTISSPLQQEFTAQCGASATPVAWNEVYTSLSSGIIEGLKIASPDIMSNNLDECLNYGVLDRHTFLFGFYFVSQSFLDSLPKNLKQVVIDAIHTGTDTQTTFNQQKEVKANQDFIAGGGKIHELTEEERATFLPAKDAMKKWYVEKYGDEWLIKLENAITQAENNL